MSISFAQIGLDSGNSKLPQRISGNDNLLTPSPSYNSPKIDLLIPRENPKSNFSLEKEESSKNIGFGEESKFANNGKGFQDSFNERPGIDLTPFRRDEYLGDTTTDSKKVKILCRDYQYVDGDRISVSLNDKVIVPNIFLGGNFTSISAKLQPGFNKIEFEALNMGESPPNTAEFIVYDDQGNAIANHEWAIATGFKASFVIIKNEK